MWITEAADTMQTRFKAVLVERSVPGITVTVPLHEKGVFDQTS